MTETSHRGDNCHSPAILSKTTRQDAKLINQDTINSLKRRKTFARFAKTTNATSIRSIGSGIVLAVICLLCLIATTQTIHCDVLCPRDASFIYPCTCFNGTQGLLIKCSKLNMAVLAISLGQLTEDPIESLEIEQASISRLFGPILSDSQAYPRLHENLRELAIRSTGLKQIDSSSLSSQLASSLQFLVLDRNQISQLPYDTLAQLSNLRLLNLSTNLISSLDSPIPIKLTNLTELDLSNNRLSKLSRSFLQHLNSLEVLSLASNELQKLEKNLFSFGRKLRHLDLSGNKLTTLDRQDLNDLTSLETLILANNQLTTVPRSIFSRNAKLYTLDLSFNKLDDIDTYLFKSVRFLKDLNMAGNLIKEITKNTFSPTTRLKRLNLSQNQLQSLSPETFKGLEWLELIDLSQNQIVNISTDAFNHIYQVEINLSHNKLARIFYWAFHEVSNITKLDLSHNQIVDGISLIAFEQSDCAQLDLSHNLIEDISKIPVGNLTGIKWLNISHNQITELNKKSFTNQKVPLYELAVIDASYNNISQISGNIFERLRSLRLFNMSHNSLRRLTSSAFGNSPTLLELDLSHNNLVEVVAGTLVGLVSMRNIDLSYNRLKKMIQVPVALNSIHMEHNEINQLNKKLFPSLNSLLELHLDHNRVTSIDEDTFSTLLALNYLSLSHNNLSSVPLAALKDLTSLMTLKLDANNIQRLTRRAFGSLPTVFDLSLDQNNISQIADHAFEGMLQLLRLNLSYNRLSELNGESFAGLVSLQTLDLSNNWLQRLENKTHRSPMDDLLSLEVANFSSNKLSIITGKSFLASRYVPYRLSQLDLSNNLIGVLANNFADGLKRVEWLSLRNNIINEIYPHVLSNASHLRHLDLSQNRIRTLKDYTFGPQMVNLTSLVLSSNKLSSLNIRELEYLTGLNYLDLSSNRLESFPGELARWVKRGLVLDLRHNQLDCNCDLLPFVAWTETIRARNQTTATGGGYYHQPVLSGSRSQRNRMNGPGQQQAYAKLMARYQQAAQLSANASCAKPEVMAQKQITHLLELASSSSSELTCDRGQLDEVDLLRRLRAPVQFNQAEAYYSDGRKYLKIGWTLTEAQVDLSNFVLIRIKLAQQIDVSAYRSSKRGQQLVADQLKPVEQQVDFVSYNQQSSVTSDAGLDERAAYLVCLTYETHQTSSESAAMAHQALIEQLRQLTNSSGIISASQVGQLLSDFRRVNCIELASLLQLNDRSEMLTSSAAASIKLRPLATPVGQVASSLFATTTVATAALSVWLCHLTLGAARLAPGA